jgi:hypothetical protein
MAMLLGLLALVAGIGSIICWIIILIEMFKRENVVLGILGIICGLWAFIWGWMNLPKHGKRQIMQIWTACILAGIVLNVLSAVMAPRQ